MTLPTCARGWQVAVADDPIDVIVQPTTGRRKKLLIADMDSTMIGQECVDELADLVGLREHVAAITERAMRGEVAFEGALRERVALLAGVTLAQIETLLTRITLTPGARQLVRTMRAHGAYTALVSGGFTQFTEPVAERIGFHETRANHLEIADGALTGAVVAPILGKAKPSARRLLNCARREGCRGMRRWRSGTAPMISRCCARRVWASPFTPSRKWRRRRMRCHPRRSHRGALRAGV